MDNPPSQKALTEAGPQSESSLVDGNALAIVAAGDSDLQRQLLHLFVEQARAIEPRLFSTEDAADRASALHLLTGSARAIAAMPVALQAEAVQRALAAGEQPGNGLTALRLLLAQTCEFAARLASRL